MTFAPPVPSLREITNLIVDAREGGARFNGSTDDSANLQSVIDGVSAAGGGVIQFPAKVAVGNIVLKQGVYLVGNMGGYGYLPGSVTQATLKGAATGIVIDTPVSGITTCGVIGININGLGSGTSLKGIRFRDVDWGLIRDVQINNMADEGILFDAATRACAIDHVLATNCVLNRSRAAIIGAVDISGADHWLTRLEAGISGSVEGTVQSVSLYCVGIAWRAANGFMSDCIGELSDIGIYVSGSRSRFTSSRADLNYGHGWQIVGTDNQFANCLGLNNSQDTTNTYSNWQATSASARNLFANCRGDDNITKKAKYGFEDLVSGATTKNVYSNCHSTTAVTAQYLNQNSSGSGFAWPSGSNKTLTADSATPDVTGYERFTTANTVATTITNFAGGVAGQRIVVLCNDANTTIQHNGSTIILQGAGNKKLRSGVTYEFYRMGTTWREIDTLPLGVTPDVGNSPKTLLARQTEETQIWNTALTADRTVTLSTTGAYAGARFRIVRTAASSGGFNLNIGTGPLKSLSPGQWAEVTYDGSSWVLTAAGSL